VDGSRIGKEKVADSKISGYVWTGPKASEIMEVKQTTTATATATATPSNKRFNEQNNSCARVL